MAQPWSDLLVIQIGGSIACSFTAKLLVELGAECVMVEQPDAQDPVRVDGTGADWPVRDAGPLHTYLNWSKQSVACDYSQRGGIDLVSSVCSSADIVIRARFSRELEAYWAETSAMRSPSLIELIISPFGTTGPYADYRADSAAILALAGITYTDGDPDREPLTIQPDIAEYFIGADGLASILAALHHRDRTGEGVRIELAMYDSVLKFDEYNLLFPQAIGIVRKRFYSRGISGFTPDVFECRDGYVMGGASRNGPDMAVLIERPDLIDSALFSDPEYRMKHWDELDALMRPWMKAHDRDDIVTRAQRLRMHAAPVLGVDDLAQSEHVREREGLRFSEDASGIRVALAAPPFRLASYEPPHNPAPVRGQHSSDWTHSRAGADRRDSGFPAARVTESAAAALPLDGVRILDFTHVWAGPAATRILADLGADVIKVEGINHVDLTRNLWFMDNDASGDFWNRSPYFQNRNQNKRGIAVDLGTEAGRDIVRRLVPLCDAVVENFTPRVMPHWGLDYSSLSALNNQLVMVSMAGYGARGSFANYSAMGISLNGAAGFASGNGYPGGPPMKSGTAFMDAFAGVCAAGAVMAALLERQRTGKGQWIDLSQHEVGMSALGGWFAEYSRTGRLPERRGNRSRHCAPQGIYPCRGDDAWVYISIRSDEQWRDLSAVLGDDRLALAPNFAAVSQRLAEHDALDVRLGELTRSWDKFSLMVALQRRSIIAAPVLDGDEVLDNEQLRARGMLEPITFEGARRPYLSHRYVGARFDKFEARPISKAPSLGEHNRQVLRELCGLSDAACASLEAAGIVGSEPRFAMPLEQTRAALRFPAEEAVRLGTAKWRRARLATG